MCSGCALLTSGTSISWPRRERRLLSTAHRLVGVEPGGWLSWSGLAHCWVLRDRAPDVGPGLIFSTYGPLLSPHCRVGEGWGRPYLENYTVDASIFVARQATKGTWWMPWHQEPMKDVGACDKPWGVGNRALIRGCPNGETQLESCPVTRI